MKVTTKNRIINYLKYRDGWISGSELEAMAAEWRTKSSTIDRRAREAEEEGLIVSSLSPRRTIQYAHPTRRPLSSEEANNFVRGLSVNL